MNKPYLSKIYSIRYLLKVDEIFEAAAESLISRKKAIYDKYRLLILKQSMVSISFKTRKKEHKLRKTYRSTNLCMLYISQKNVPSSEEVMLDQVFVNDEQAFLKKEREKFTEYEGKVTNFN